MNEIMKVLIKFYNIIIKLQNNRPTWSTYHQYFKLLFIDGVGMSEWQ